MQVLQNRTCRAGQDRTGRATALYVSERVSSTTGWENADWSSLHGCFSHMLPLCLVDGSEVVHTFPSHFDKLIQIHTGLTLTPVQHPWSQDGKNIADGMVAIAKRKLEVHLNMGNDIVSAENMKEGLGNCLSSSFCNIY